MANEYVFEMRDITKAFGRNIVLDGVSIAKEIELEDTFDIQIEASEIVPENFNSVNAMWTMINRLQENS